MKIKYGSIVVDGRGKIGGHVASKNRGGSYLRTKVTPVNPRSAVQSAVRSRFGGFSTGWRLLSQAQRDAWTGQVANYQKTDIFADVRNLTGLQLYQRLNNNLVSSGGTAIANPLTPKGVSTVAINSLTYTVGTAALSLVLSAATPASSRVKVFATPPLSAGISFVKSQFRLIANLAPSSVTPVNLLSAYQSKYGSLGVVGSKIFVQIEFVDQTTGLNSARQTIAAIAAS